MDIHSVHTYPTHYLISMNDSIGITNLGFSESNPASINGSLENFPIKEIRECYKLNAKTLGETNGRSFSSDSGIRVLSTRSSSSPRRSLCENSLISSHNFHLQPHLSFIDSDTQIHKDRFINPLAQSHGTATYSIFHEGPPAPSLPVQFVSYTDSECSDYIMDPKILKSTKAEIPLGLLNNNNIHINCKSSQNPSSSIHSAGSDSLSEGSKITKRRPLGIQRRIAMNLKGKWIGPLIQYLVAYPLLVAGVWALLYIFWGQDAFPGGSLFALLVLELASISMGHLANLLGFPPLLGMLSAGLILRNVPSINIAGDIHYSISSPLRGISVVILLTRGAFSINPSNIKKFKNAVPSLAIGSCVIEAILGSISAYFVLGFPPAWAALMGCILSAMSGVAVMPYLLEVEQSLASPDIITTEKAKETLVIAKTACGMDAILAICMAEFCLGFIFGQGVLSTSLLKGFGEVALGGTWGLLWGAGSGFLLYEKRFSDSKVIAAFCGGVMSLLGLTTLTYPRGGPLGTFLGALIAISVWRSREPSSILPVNEAFDKLWFVFQPLLFGILGARTDFATVDWNIIYKGALCLLISITSRLFASYFMTSWAKLSFRERLFLIIAWLPKGTVQAALGPVALDTSYSLGLEDDFTSLGYKVMNVAAATIILAGFFGSLLLRIAGGRILRIN